MASTPTSAAEQKIIGWFFGVAIGLAVLFIAWSWHSRSQECAASCELKGFKEGHLELNKGGRLNLGSHCVCEK